MTRIKMHIFNVKLLFYPPCEVKCGLQNVGRGFLLSERQGSLLKLLLKKPMEGPTVLGRVLDIIMNPAKQGILPFFLSWWPGHNKWPNNSISNPFVQDMIQFFRSTWDHRWLLDHFSFNPLPFFSN